MRAALEPRILILCPLGREWSFLVKTFEASRHVERVHDLKVEAAYIPDWRALVAPGAAISRGSLTGIIYVFSQDDATLTDRTGGR
jgi:hypothetical protein